MIRVNDWLRFSTHFSKSISLSLLIIIIIFAHIVELINFSINDHNDEALTFAVVHVTTIILRRNTSTWIPAWRWLCSISSLFWIIHSLCQITTKQQINNESWIVNAAKWLNDARPSNGWSRYRSPCRRYERVSARERERERRLRPSVRRSYFEMQTKLWTEKKNQINRRPDLAQWTWPTCTRTHCAQFKADVSIPSASGAALIRFWLTITFNPLYLAQRNGKHEDWHSFLDFERFRRFHTVYVNLSFACELFVSALSCRAKRPWFLNRRQFDLIWKALITYWSLTGIRS